MEKNRCSRGHPEVVDADLADLLWQHSPYRTHDVGSAPGSLIGVCLHLIKMWLDFPVEETDKRGRKTRTTEARDSRRGIPQGSCISPLLARTLPLHAPVRAGGGRSSGLERGLGTRLVTYADDLVILCRKGNAEEALARLREIMPAS